MAEFMSDRIAKRGTFSLQPGHVVPPVALSAPRAAAGRSRSIYGTERNWTINGDFFRLPREGVARYARELVVALDGLLGEGHRSSEGLRLRLVSPVPLPSGFDLHNIRVRVVPEAIRPRLPQVWVQCQLPRHVEGGLLSFCNLAPVAVSRQIVCIHDLQTRLTPQSYGRLFRWTHRALLPVLGRRVARIVTVSETSRRHLARYGVAAAGKVTVGYNGCDHARRWRPDRAGIRPGGDRPYVLCMGRTQAHKNLDLLRHIAPRLDAAGIDLTIVGAPDLLRPLVGEASNIRYPGRLDDDSLAAALRAAHCLVLPSRFEGFGLPAVEAMIWECPVVAASAPCLPEICADAALYADPDRPDAWVAAILSLADPKTRGRLVEAGRRRADRFTWRAVAETYLSLMAQIDAAEVAR